jgi:hypothetical protein
MISVDYTVASHCLIMSHYVPEEYALEALLHDAAEAYMGDIIWPVKSYLDEQTDGAVSDFENRFLGHLMWKLGGDMACVEVNSGGPIYVKSAPVAKADMVMGQHEWAVLGRGDEFETDDELAGVFEYVNQRYADDYMDVGQPWWAWLRRYHELTNTEYDYHAYVGLFFPDYKKPEKEMSDDEKITEALKEDLEGLGVTDEEWEDILSKAEELAEEMVK